MDCIRPCLYIQPIPKIIPYALANSIPTGFEYFLVIKNLIGTDIRLMVRRCCLRGFLVQPRAAEQLEHSTWASRSKEKGTPIKGVGNA
jgi:hypothetical protein